MFVRAKKKSNGKTSIQIVESYRRGDKVKQKIIRHIGQGVTENEIEELKKLANSIVVRMENDRKPVLPIFKPEKFYDRYRKKPIEEKVNLNNIREEQRVIDGFSDIFGKVYSDLNFDDLIKGTRNNKQWNDILKHCVISRIADPGSKRRSASFLEQDFGIRIPLEKIYRTMDHVYNREEKIKERVFSTTLSLFKEEVDILFFDVTTLYFESFSADELREFGFSKDCKFKETQVVLALVTTKDGFPVTYKLFPGNTYEGDTLIEMIKDLKQSYEVSKVVLVADRAMFNDKNLKLMDDEGITYIVAAKLKNMSKAKKQEILSDDYKANVVNNELTWIKEFEYKSRRLIVSYSNKRAMKDSSDRQRLIDRLMKKVKNGKVKLSEIIPNNGTKKYLEVKGKKAEVNTEKMEKDAEWDGLHGVITNSEDKTPGELLTRYRDLWQIEAAFRVNKHNLKMRPIFHWKEERIRAHICMCFLSYTLAKHVIHQINVQYQNMSFEQIKNELAHAQSSICIDIDTKKKYCIPSHLTKNMKRIYQVFGLKRSDVPSELV